MFCSTDVSKQATEKIEDDDDIPGEVLRGILQEFKIFRHERERAAILEKKLLPDAGARQVAQALGTAAPSGDAKGNRLLLKNSSTKSLGQDRFGGSPTEVGIAVVIRRIHDLDTVKQTFAVMANLSMQWKMPPGENPPLAHEDDGDWTPKWTPKVRLRSTIEDDCPDILYTTKEDEDGNQLVVCESRHVAIISEQLELADFPNDAQDLPISFISMLPVDSCIWIPHDTHPVASLDSHRCVLNDFGIISECPFTHELYTFSTAGKDVSALTVNVKVSRHSRYYIINVAFIMGLIASCILLTWGMHPAKMAERFNVDFSLLLTAVAFKFALSEMLPPISYLTTIDYYILACFVFLVVCTLTHAILPLFYFKKAQESELSESPEADVDGDGGTAAYEGEDPFIDADMQCFWILICVWIGWNIGYWLFFYVKKAAVYDTAVEKARQQKARFEDKARKHIHASQTNYLTP